MGIRVIVTVVIMAVIMPASGMVVRVLFGRLGSRRSMVMAAAALIHGSLRRRMGMSLVVMSVVIMPASGVVVRMLFGRLGSRRSMVMAAATFIRGSLHGRMVMSLVIMSVVVMSTSRVVMRMLFGLLLNRRSVVMSVMVMPAGRVVMLGPGARHSRVAMMVVAAGLRRLCLGGLQCRTEAQPLHARLDRVRSRGSLGQGQAQRLLGHGNLDVGDARQLFERGSDGRGTAAAIHAIDLPGDGFRLRFQSLEGFRGQRHQKSP
ncbi:hypothetical protein J2Y55_004954 [Bosea sp. BE125]|nr:hypothetical protein [Bosea sp. BE125]MDR6873923.1 hypothetical protein [Bosea sp. BE125]